MIKKIQKDETGFSALEIIIVLIIIGCVAGAGYYVFNKQKTKVKSDTTSNSVASNTTPNVTTASKVAWTAQGPAILGTFADAEVVKISDTEYRMYYGVQPEVQNNKLEVYSAKSTDGITWQQESGTRKAMATFPDVVKLKDGRYRMYYQGAAEIKSAISADGLTFTDESGARIDKSNTENLTLDNVAAPSVTNLDDGTFVIVYRGTINTRYASNTPNPTTQVLLWATSTDGLVFTKKGMAVDSRTETLNGQLDGPDLMKLDDGKYRLLATTYTGVYEFTFDGKTFGKPELALAGEAVKDNKGFHGSPPGDPATIKIGSTWYMYYGGPREQNGIHYATLK